MNRRKTVSDVMREVAQAADPAQRVQILQQNNSWELRTILGGAYNPNIKFVFDTPPQYKKQIVPKGFAYSPLGQELQRAYLFQVGHPRVDSNLTLERKKIIAIQILENLEEDDAKLFLGMLMKDLRVPGLTSDIVKQAFPNL